MHRHVIEEIGLCCLLIFRMHKTFPGCEMYILLLCLCEHINPPQIRLETWEVGQCIAILNIVVYVTSGV